MSGAPLVILVDDDASMARAMGRILEVGGMRPLAFSSAEALLAHLPADAEGIVIDVQLPGMDGLALYRKLRALGAAYPAVFVSAQHEAEARVRALDPSCVFLEKPFAGRVLLEAMKRLLDEAA